MTGEDDIAIGRFGTYGTAWNIYSRPFQFIADTLVLLQYQAGLSTDCLLDGSVSTLDCLVQGGLGVLLTSQHVFKLFVHDVSNLREIDETDTL